MLICIREAVAVSAKARGWRKCGCYVWRTRKPTAPIGLPFIGRHFAYVGKTSSRWHRDAQHMERQPWSDLDPKVYALWVPFPHWNWTRSFMERFYTAILLPVYPVEFNGGNPRRIEPWQAKQHRAERDSIGRTASALLRFAVRLGLWLMIMAIFAYGYTHWVK